MGRAGRAGQRVGPDPVAAREIEKAENWEEAQKGGKRKSTLISLSQVLLGFPLSEPAGWQRAGKCCCRLLVSLPGHAAGQTRMEMDQMGQT